MALALGIDLGGNTIKLGAFDTHSGDVIEQATRPTRDGESVDGQPAWAREISAWIMDIERKHGTAERIGLAAPGLASRDFRRIEFMPGRMLGLQGFDWSAWLGRKVSVLNDAQAALLGERWRGAAQGMDDVFLLTLGTGVGGAIISAGKLMTGHIGRAGHLGHISLDIDGPPTVAGTPGGLDWQIGNASVAQRSGGRFHSTAALAEAVKAGDPLAISVWQRSLDYLACGIASLINVLDPEGVIIGGGISTVGELLFQPLEEKLARVEWRPGGHRVKLLPAQLGEWAGAWGAAQFQG